MTYNVGGKQGTNIIMNVFSEVFKKSKSGLVRNYSAGSTILYQGEVPRSAFIIRSGVVKSFNISTDGTEQIVNFHVPGEVVPLGWLFGKATASIYFFETMTDTTLLLLPRDQLIDQIGRDPALTQHMLEHAVSSYTAAMLHICALEQTKAPQKILYTLYYLSRKFGTVNRNKTTDIVLELTHQDIASLVGLTRETTATELSKLKKQGVLDYKNKKYRVDTAALIESMGEDSFLAVKF